MELIEMLKNLGIIDYIGIVAVAFTLIEVTPIKINPWSTLAKMIGRALNVELMDKISENEAKEMRYRILRFDDEIRHNIVHTEEHFNQIVDDLDNYEDYCTKHPGYKNNKAELAISNIRQTYDKCRKEHSFLP